MIRWGASQWLPLLLAVPALALLAVIGAAFRRRALRRLADPGLVPRLTDSRSGRLAAAKTACVLTGLALLLVAVARPQWGEKLQVYKGRGIDIVFALDASKSMLAGDVPPSRLARAKSQIAALLDNLTTNRVGIVAFAGEAQVMCPLTPDVEAAKLFLDIIDPGNMPKPGTNIQHAVEAAASLFDPGPGHSKALVLITDGDNLDGDPGVATQIAASQGIRIFAVGVGTPEGSTIPESGTSGTSYAKDANDQIVVTRLAERLLLVMAKATNGRYFRSASVNLDELVAALDQMQKKAIGGGEYVEYEERYQGFLLAGFVLLLLGLVLNDRRGEAFGSWWRARARRGPRSAPAAGIRTRTAAIATVAMIALAACAHADVGASMRRGLALEKSGKYDEAVRAYQEALVLQPDNVRIHYDIGRALYALQRYPEASEHFQLGLLTKSKKLRARSLYNMGNSHVRQRQLDEAIAAYTQALLQRPGDRQAQENLEYCWKLKDQPQQPDSSQQQKQPQNQQQPQQQPQQGGQQQSQAQPQKGAISKEQADRMLQALEGKEQETLKRQPKKPQASAGAGGKDW